MIHETCNFAGCTSWCAYARNIFTLWHMLLPCATTLLREASALSLMLLLCCGLLNVRSVPHSVRYVHPSRVLSNIVSLPEESIHANHFSFSREHLLYAQESFF